jgi:hypothetical protein
MSPLPRRVAALFAGALLALPCARPFAAAQLYKCVDGGRTVYQQQACSVSTQPEAAASAPRLAAKASAPAADAASAASRKLRSSSPASSAPATPR